MSLPIVAGGVVTFRRLRAGRVRGPMFKCIVDRPTRPPFPLPGHAAVFMTGAALVADSLIRP